MALPFTGAYARRYAQPYAGHTVWGTGWNPVHLYYGSPPARLNPTRPMEGRPLPAGQLAEISQPWEALPDQIIPANIWGYQPEDQPNTYLYYGDRPPWDVPPQDSPVRIASDDMPPWDAPGRVNSAFRSTRGGARRTFRDVAPAADEANYPIPSETVSEGWINKGLSGVVAVAKPSDPAQYERQTSMQQRFATRSNDLAVARATDEARSPIRSRVMPMLAKAYSRGEREYDMFPRQQSPDTERPFFYRTAGTGQADWMEVNQQWDVDAVERTPPPDPYIGRYDGSGVSDYGYMPEDQFYA